MYRLSIGALNIIDGRWRFHRRMRKRDSFSQFADTKFSARRLSTIGALGLRERRDRGVELAIAVDVYGFPRIGTSYRRYG